MTAAVIRAPDDVRRLYDRKASFHQTYKGLGGSVHQAWLDANPKERIGYACACVTDLPRPGRRATPFPGEGPFPGSAGPGQRPAVVLDPFGGTGTTALVASALGRHGITVDLSADYCRLATWRLSDPGERARALQVTKPPPVHDDQMPLFDLAAAGP